MTTYFIAPAQSPRDRYAAGHDANTFTSRREARLAIESLTETCGGEWVVSEEPTETMTAAGWHDLDIADGELAVRIDGGVPVGLSLTQGEHDRAPTVEAITAEVRRLTGFDVRYDAHGWSAAEGGGEVCVGLEVAAADATYTTSHSDGRADSHATLHAAIEALREQYPDLYALHEVGQDEVSDSDTAIQGERDGHRVLVWETEDESTDDSGAHAVASIRREVRS